MTIQFSWIVAEGTERDKLREKQNETKKMERTDELVGQNKCYWHHKLSPVHKWAAAIKAKKKEKH